MFIKLIQLLVTLLSGDKILLSLGIENGSMSWAHIYIGSTHIDDTKNNFLSSHTLSTFLRFFLIKVFFKYICLTLYW